MIIDYKKAFGSVEPSFVWIALSVQGVQKDYIDLHVECYTGCSTFFKPFHREIEVQTSKGVRQGDSISPVLFSACLEEVIKHCKWANGRNLTHLRFADDIVLITGTPDEATSMINSLNWEGKEVGLVINTQKTIVMRNSFSQQDPIYLDGFPLEDVEEYVYLGRVLTISNGLAPELQRRKAGWAAFRTIRTVTDATNDSRLKSELFNSTVLLALIMPVKLGL